MGEGRVDVGASGGSAAVILGSDVDPVRGAVPGGFERRKFIAATLLGMLPAASLFTATMAQVATPDSDGGDVTYSRRAAAAWLADQQRPDGGFAGPSGESDLGTTIDAMYAAYALRMYPGIDAAVNYLLPRSAEYVARGPAAAARIALVAVMLDITWGWTPDAELVVGKTSEDCLNLYWPNGADLLPRMAAPRTTPSSSAIPGLIGDNLHDHALVIIAHGALWASLPESALEPFRVAQGRDGGWARDGSTAPGAADAHTTALVIQAIMMAEQWDMPLDPKMFRRGFHFLRSLRVPGGGFAYNKVRPMVADATSTALVLRALIAAYKDPSKPEWGDVPQALARFWLPSGGFRSLMSADAPDLEASLQAIPAMEGKPLPVKQLCTT
jgi:hypothetical protein